MGVRLLKADGGAPPVGDPMEDDREVFSEDGGKEGDRRG